MDKCLPMMFRSWMTELLAARRVLMSIPQRPGEGESIPYCSHRLFFSGESAVIGGAPSSPLVVRKAGVMQPMSFSLDSPVSFIEAMVSMDAILLACARRTAGNRLACPEVLDFCNTLWQENAIGTFLSTAVSKGMSQAIRQASDEHDRVSVAWRVLDTMLRFPSCDVPFDYRGEEANWAARLSDRMPEAQGEITKHVNGFPGSNIHKC